MGKVIIHGVKEDGLFDAEVKSTATLVTELIDRYTKMCEADIYSALDEIRKSAEQDARARKIYTQVIQEKNKINNQETTECGEKNAVKEENKELKLQLREAKARADHFERIAEQIESEKEKAYMRGRINGLEFAIRCNGVSGDGVK